MRRVIWGFLLCPLLVFGKTCFEYEPFTNGVIGVIHLNSLNEEDLRGALAELKATGPLKGLVLDLRSSTGGVLTQAVKTIEIFSQKGGAPLRLVQVPMVILVAKTPEPAAKVICQALQEKGVAVVFSDEIVPAEPEEVALPTGLEKICKSQLFTVWQKMVSRLVENSFLRKTGDRNWQRRSEGKPDGCGSEDLQKREGINIIKDMIFLSS